MADLISRESVLPILAGIARTQGEYDASYDKLKQIPSASRWISCAEQLPERETDVLVYIPVWEDNPIQVAYLMYDGITWELSDGEFNFGKREVLYWMQMPEPPKGGAEDGQSSSDA